MMMRIIRCSPHDDDELQPKMRSPYLAHERLTWVPLFTRAAGSPRLTRCDVLMMGSLLPTRAAHYKPAVSMRLPRQGRAGENGSIIPRTKGKPR